MPRAVILRCLIHLTAASSNLPSVPQDLSAEGTVERPTFIDGEPATHESHVG